MLHLSRKVGQSIIIGQDSDIIITVTRIDGYHVSLGITAPKSVPVHREEIYLRIQKERNLPFSAAGKGD